MMDIYFPLKPPKIVASEWAARCQHLRNLGVDGGGGGGEIGGSVVSSQDAMGGCWTMRDEGMMTLKWWKVKMIQILIVSKFLQKFLFWT